LIIDDNDSADALGHERGDRAANGRCLIAGWDQHRDVIVVDKIRRAGIQALGRTPRAPRREEYDEPEA
jgi:hypothetical protein